MTHAAARVGLATALRRAGHPPFREWQFWALQAAVVLIALLHLEVDLHPSLETKGFPVGVPVALLVVPVAYAALRYGLGGSAATGAWATLLWLPDLLLPHDQGHVGSDVVNLALVDFVAFVIGLRIEAERLARARADRETNERVMIEVRYRQLFEANRAPIVVLDGRHEVVDANPAARASFGDKLRIGAPLEVPLVEGSPALGQPARALRLPDGKEYRVAIAELPAQAGSGLLQAVFEDVTEERTEGRRATAYASALVQAEEDQRRRLARELHDEPLQLFLHLARQLESLVGHQNVPQQVRHSLEQARHQALDAAGRLRAIARGLRPPALDQLGLPAALASLVADVEEEAHLTTELEICVNNDRLPRDVELGAFRIVEEALRNAVRHSGATLARVTLRLEGNELSVTVSDNGKGFSPATLDELASQGHLGLVGVTERAHLLGGHLEVRSAPGAGTEVEAVLPLQRP